MSLSNLHLNKKKELSNIKIIDQLYLSSTKKARNYFNIFYDEYLGYLDEMKKPSKKNIRKWNENKKEILIKYNEIWNLNNKIEGKVFSFVKELTYEIKKKIKKENVNLNQEIDSFDKTCLNKKNITTLLNAQNFFNEIHVNNRQENFNFYFNDIKENLNYISNDLDLLLNSFSNSYSWIFNLKFRFLEIIKRSNRIYNTKLVDIRKNIKFNISDKKMINSYIENFNELKKLTEIDYKENLDIAKNEVSLINDSVYNYINSLINNKEKFVKKINDFVNDLYFDLSNFKNYWLLSEDKNIERKGVMITIKNIAECFIDDKKFMNEIDEKIFESNKKSKLLWEDFNRKILDLNKDLAKILNHRISESSYLFNISLMENEWLKRSVNNFSLIHISNLNFINNVIKGNFSNK